MSSVVTSGLDTRVRAINKGERPASRTASGVTACRRGIFEAGANPLPSLNLAQLTPYSEDVLDGLKQRQVPGVRRNRCAWRVSELQQQVPGV